MPPWAKRMTVAMLPGRRGYGSGQSSRTNSSRLIPASFRMPARSGRFRSPGWFGTVISFALSECAKTRWLPPGPDEPPALAFEHADELPRPHGRQPGTHAVILTYSRSGFGSGLPSSSRASR